MTEEDLAFRYVCGELTRTQLNYWVVTHELDTQLVEDLIANFEKQASNAGAFGQMCLMIFVLGILLFVFSVFIEFISKGFFT